MKCNESMVISVVVSLLARLKRDIFVTMNDLYDLFYWKYNTGYKFSKISVSSHNDNTIWFGNKPFTHRYLQQAWSSWL